MVNEAILEKWKVLVDACKNYYIDSLPTGLSDSEFDNLERRAMKEDGFSARDYVFQTYSVGRRVKNSYIEKFKKVKVEGTTMMEAINKISSGRKLYWDLKYDGTSIAIYLDPKTGRPIYKLKDSPEYLERQQKILMGQKRNAKISRMVSQLKKLGLTVLDKAGNQM